MRAPVATEAGLAGAGPLVLARARNAFNASFTDAVEAVHFDAFGVIR
jgi:hypothetical protein